VQNLGYKDAYIKYSGELSTKEADYIFPDSDRRMLSESEILAFDDWQRYIARNEIYARLGRGFQRQDLRDYFSAKDWYTERYSPAEFDARGRAALNDYEYENALKIREIEEQLGSPYL
jgi:hypothetical protein